MFLSTSYVKQFSDLVPAHIILSQTSEASTFTSFVLSKNINLHTCLHPNLHHPYLDKIKLLTFLTAVMEFWSTCTFSLQIVLS